MSSKFKKKIAERPTEELVELLRREREAYPREVIAIIEEVLEERDVDLDNLNQETREEESSDSTVSSSSDTLSSSPVSGDKGNNNYRTLQILAGFIKIFSLIFLIGAGIFSFVYAQGNLIDIAIIIFLAIIFIIPYFAFSKIIYLFIDIEDNMRQTRDLLKKLAGKE